MSEANGHTFGLIADGQNYPGYIAAVARLHPAVRFTYRPMLRAEKARMGRTAADASADAWVKAMAQAMQKRIVTWDFSGKDGVLPKSEATLMSLVPALFDKLFAIISGEIPPDADPKDLQAEEFDEAAVQKN